MPLRFPKGARLRAADDFARMKREGTTYPGRFMVLSVLAVGPVEEPPRLGIITTRRIGGAVARSVVRRRLRELFRLSRPQLTHGRWLVLIARVGSTQATYAALEKDWRKVVQRSGLLQPTAGL